MLLLVAARRRGDRLPGRIIGPLGWPAVALAIGGVFLFGVVSFGLWIWDSTRWNARPPWSSGVAMVALTIVSWRRGAFTPRTVVEYRLETGHRTAASCRSCPAAEGRADPVTWTN